MRSLRVYPQISELTWLDSDNPGTRALHYFAMRSSSLTVPMCLDACEAGGFALAGVEYSSECCACTVDSFAALQLSTLLLRVWKFYSV